MKGSASKIQLAGCDDLFQTGGKAEANGEQVQEVPLAELFPFKDHPFQVRDAGENCGLTVTRYIALTKLISPLLTLVDEDKLSFNTAADYIAILTEQEQTSLPDGVDLFPVDKGQAL